MSVVYSAGMTQYNAGVRTDPGKNAVKSVTCFDTYEAANLAAASTIHMFRPPKGAKWNGVGFLAWDDLSGTSTYTLAVGIAGTTDKFLAATSAVAAADMAALDAGATAISAIGYEFDGETDVIITTAGSAADATGTISLMMEFFMP